MNARFRLSAAALCVAAALAGCGSVTGGTAFQPPKGWSATPAIFGRGQVWFKAGKDQSSPQMLFLIKGNPNDTSTNFNILPSEYAKDVHVVKRGSTQLCGTQTAQQLVAQGTGKDGKREQIEVMSTVIGANRYVAMYLRPAATAADPQAEGALHSLCPLKP